MMASVYIIGWMLVAVLIVRYFQDRTPGAGDSP
jgi:hypothetical protein